MSDQALRAELEHLQARNRSDGKVVQTWPKETERERELRGEQNALALTITSLREELAALRQREEVLRDNHDSVRALTARDLVYSGDLPWDSHHKLILYVALGAFLPVFFLGLSIGANERAAVCGAVFALGSAPVVDLLRLRRAKSRRARLAAAVGNTTQA